MAVGGGADGDDPRHAGRPIEPLGVAIVARSGDHQQGYTLLRQALARGTPWTPELIDSLMPGGKG